jgi:hypothetical protein
MNLHSAIPVLTVMNFRNGLLVRPQNVRKHLRSRRIPHHMKEPQSAAALNFVRPLKAIIVDLKLNAYAGLRFSNSFEKSLGRPWPVVDCQQFHARRDSGVRSWHIGNDIDNGPLFFALGLLNDK